MQSSMIIKLLNGTRKRPSKKRQRELVIKQGGKCFYCGLEFGSYFEWQYQLVCVRKTFDHLLAFCYSGNSSDDNFVASCFECNGLKSGKVFDSIKEAKDYVKKRRIQKGLPLSRVRKVIYSKEDVAKVLSSKMQDEKLLEASRGGVEEKRRALMMRSKYYRIRLLGMTE